MNRQNLNNVPVAVTIAETIESAGCHRKLDQDGIHRLLLDTSGQDLIEYALVAALVGLGALAAMKGLKNSIGNAFNGVGTSLTNA